MCYMKIFANIDWRGYDNFHIIFYANLTGCVNFFTQGRIFFNPLNIACDRLYVENLGENSNKQISKFRYELL